MHMDHVINVAIIQNKIAFLPTIIIVNLAFLRLFSSKSYRHLKLTQIIFSHKKVPILAIHKPFQNTRFLLCRMRYMKHTERLAFCDF